VLLNIVIFIYVLKEFLCIFIQINSPVWLDKFEHCKPASWIEGVFFILQAEGGIKTRQR
jgi:hypothetical protein